MIPPNAIIFTFVECEIKLNLAIFKKKSDFFVLKTGATKISTQPCLILFVNSFLLCAEPIIVKFLLTFKFLKLVSLLKEGI